jgi:hypothetical protein
MSTPPTERTETGRTVRILIGIGILLVGIAAFLSVLSRANLVEATGTFSGVASLELDLTNGPIVVVAGEDDQVIVEKSFTSGFFGGTAREEQNGDTLRLIQRCPVLLGLGCRGSYRVTVPPGTTISGGTSNGPIRVEDIDGAIDVTTSNGEISLDGLTAQVTARTSNGSVTGTALHSADLDVSTSNGRVSLVFAAVPTSVAVRTSNGNIEIAIPPDSPPFALSTSTSNGQVRNEIRTDPAASEVIDLRTSNGDITLVYSG